MIYADERMAVILDAVTSRHAQLADLSFEGNKDPQMIDLASDRSQGLQLQILSRVLIQDLLQLDQPGRAMCVSRHN